jgi:hypothetical protein
MERGKKKNDSILRRGRNLPGRKEKYEERFVKMAHEITLLGATMAELASILGVSASTVENWRKAYDKFDLAIRKGREIADAKVAKAMYRRAIGYSHPDVHVSSFQGQVTLTPIIKHYPPDVAAGKFLLTNKHPDKWQDTSKMESNSQHLHLHQNVDLSDISTEELEIMEKVGMKKLLTDHKRKN